MDVRQDFNFKKSFAHGLVDLRLVKQGLPLDDECINVKFPLRKARNFIFGPVDL